MTTAQVITTIVTSAVVTLLTLFVRSLFGPRPRYADARVIDKIARQYPSIMKAALGNGTPSGVELYDQERERCNYIIPNPTDRDLPCSKTIDHDGDHALSWEDIYALGYARPPF